jgi:hypothetical protein
MKSTDRIKLLQIQLDATIQLIQWEEFRICQIKEIFSEQTALCDENET